jgi:hypothetical protein
MGIVEHSDGFKYQYDQMQSNGLIVDGSYNGSRSWFGPRRALARLSESASAGDVFPATIIPAEWYDVKSVSRLTLAYSRRRAGGPIRAKGGIISVVGPRTKTPP